MTKIGRTNISPKDSISHQYLVKVNHEDIDTLNPVNNLVYLKWVNDTSEKHWAILANEEINRKYYWIKRH
jgi:acyl-CoA thioester hydrolase